MLLNILIVYSLKWVFSEDYIAHSFARSITYFNCQYTVLRSSNMDENPLSKSGILINDISDHKMIFTYIEKTAYVENFKKNSLKLKRDEISIQNFTDELKNMNIYHQLLEMNEANLEKGMKNWRRY